MPSQKPVAGCVVPILFSSAPAYGGQGNEKEETAK